MADRLVIYAKARVFKAIARPYKLKASIEIAVFVRVDFKLCIERF